MTAANRDTAWGGSGGGGPVTFPPVASLDDLTLSGKLFIRGGQPWYDVSAFPGSDFLAQISNAAAAATPGGRLLIPAGSYSLTASVVAPVLTLKSLTIEGAGPGVTTIVFSGSGYAFTIDNSSIGNAAWFNRIRNLTIDASASSTPTGLIQLVRSEFAVIENCDLIGPIGGNKILINFVDPGGTLADVNYFNKIRGCRLRGQTQASDVLVKLAASGGAGANSCYVRDNHLSVCNYAVLCDGGDSNRITGNEFNGSTNTAVRIQNASAVNVIAENRFDGPTTSLDIAAGCSNNVFGPGNSGIAPVINAGTNTVIGPNIDEFAITDTATTAIFAEPMRGLITLRGSAIVADPSTARPFIAATGSSGSYPYNQAGNLVISSRQSGAASDILLYTGNPSVERLRIDRTGLVKAAKDFQATEGLVTKHLSGAGKVTVSDADFSASGTPIDGAIAVVRNTTDSTVRIGIRSGGVWKVVQVL